ncbi:hypothetical protein C7475_102239 [Chitinophaga sp. S165]|nr:hypothetical protein C7475_102239 [Chitinophaga sp. S165]
MKLFLLEDFVPFESKTYVKQERLPGSDILPGRRHNYMIRILKSSVK